MNLSKKRYTMIGLCLALLCLTSDLCAGEANMNGKGIRQDFVEALVGGDSLLGKVKLSRLSFKGSNFDLLNGLIVKHKAYPGPDGKFVVYVKDLHRRQETQKSMMGILIELIRENDLTLAVIESEHESSITKKFVVDKFPELEKFQNGGKLPKELTKKYDAKYLIKFLNGKIEQCGAEERALHERANKINFELTYALLLGGPYEKFDKAMKAIVDDRSDKAVEKTLGFLEKNGDNYAVLIYGGAHANSIVSALEERRVSYIVIEPKGYESEFAQMVNYYLNVLGSNIGLRGERTGI